MPGRDGQIRRLTALGAGIFFALLLVGVALAYWGVWRGQDLAQRDDNPRLVAAELTVQRGRIEDSRGVLLADSIPGAIGVQRLYPVPNIGPAVGYHSFRHGTSGIEAGEDSLLRGEPEAPMEAAWRRALHRPQEGRALRLTLVAEWQILAAELMADRVGGLVLISLPDAAIRVLASEPGYDPNQLDAQFESLVADPGAPLLNRATQGLYQPGLVLAPFLLAGAIDQDLVDPGATVAGLDDPVILGSDTFSCVVPPHEPGGWADALAARCPAPWLTIGALLGEEGFRQTMDAFRFYTPPALPLAAEATDVAPIGDLEREAMGQGGLTLSPLQVTLALAALAGDGIVPRPRIVAAVTDELGEWQPRLPAIQSEPTVSATATRAVLARLPRNGGIITYSVAVLSGPDGSYNSWYLGLAPAADPQFALVLVLEESADAAAADALGTELFNSILREGS